MVMETRSNVKAACLRETERSTRGEDSGAADPAGPKPALPIGRDGRMAHLDDNKPYSTKRVEALSFFVKMSFHRLKSVVSCWWRFGLTGRAMTSVPSFFHYP